MGFLDNGGLAHFWAKVKTALSGKQDKLTGTAGQVVGFDAQGEAVAQDAPEGGITQEEADGRYLQLSGGTVTGYIKSAKEDGNSKTTVGMLELGTVTSSSEGANSCIKLWPKEQDIDYYSYEDSKTGAYVKTNRVIIRGVETPIYSGDAANKKYVDDAVSGVLPSGGTTGQALLKASDGGETWGSVATMEQVEAAIQSALGVIETELATI